MRRRELATAVLATATASALLPSTSQAQTCTPPCFARTQAEINAGVTPVNYSYPPGHVYRYGTNTTPGTTDMTVALQAALNCNFEVELPAEACLFTSLIWRFRRTIRGKGPRVSILRQAASMNGSMTPAITFESGKPPAGGTDDISDGTYRADGFCVEVASQTGLYCDNNSVASMFMSDQFRLVSRQAAMNGSPPYATILNQRGIWFNAGGVSAAFVANHRNLEIRAFDVAIDASGGVNEWKVHGWLIDCRVGVRLYGCSTWNLDSLSIETGVQNARSIQFIGAISNVIIDGGRWELTQSGGYGIEGDGSVTGANIRVRGVNVLIVGDGSGIPGRKWVGVVPDDTIIDGHDTTGPFLIVPNLIATRLPNSIKLGGQNLGNGKIVLGRHIGGADSTIQHDGTHLVLTGGNSVKLAGDGSAQERLEVDANRVILAGADGGNGYVHAMRLGANSYLWVDAFGRLRIKQGAPVGDSDGTVVGLQS